MKPEGTVFERIVDKAISVFSPKRAALRKHWRRLDRDPDYEETMLSALRARGYRAARNDDGSLTQGFNFGGVSARAGRSADGELLFDLPILIRKSRQITQDDPVGSGLIETFVTNVVGTGVCPRAMTPDFDKNRRIDRVFKDWKQTAARADDITYEQSQRVKCRSLLVDGGVFSKRTKRKPDERVWFEHVEIDRIATPLAEFAGERQVIRGIEKDEDKVPVAYWVRDAHPGDVFFQATPDASALDFQRYDKDTIKHKKLTKRPGQTHGVPFLHAVIQDIKDLDTLLVAALKRTQIAACLAAFIRSEMGMSDLMDVTAGEYGYELDQTIKPGMLFKLYPGESLETIVPNFPTPELFPFVVMIARRIGAALGVSWQIVLKDFSESNYSSARTDLLESRPTFVALRKTLIDLFQWERRVMLEDARLMGDPRMQDVSDEDIEQVVWVGDGWQWVDPEKEAKAAQLEMELGTSSKLEMAQLKGKDYEEVFRQRVQAEKIEQRVRAEEGFKQNVGGFGEGKIRATKELLVSVGKGEISPDSAKALLVSLIGLEESEAEEMVGADEPASVIPFEEAA